MAVAAAYLNDLLSFDTSTGSWARLASAEVAFAPPPRFRCGFAGAGGALFVFGGIGNSSESAMRRGHVNRDYTLSNALEGPG